GVELFGSLGATGHGHGSDRAVLLGLCGDDPRTVDTDTVTERVAAIKQDRRVLVLGEHPVTLDPHTDLVLHRRKSLPTHPNGMIFTALDSAGEVLRAGTYYSVGGGFVVDESASGADRIKADDTPVPHPFATATEL